MTFVHRITGQEEYCLSLAPLFDLKILSRIDDRMKIERTSNLVNMLKNPL